MKDEKEIGRGRPSQDLDQRLLTVARAILERDGLEALTLRAAARAAGVSHMAPYRHYASKDELLAAVATHGFHTLTHEMDDATAKRADQAGQLECLGISYVLFAMRNPALYRLMFGANLPNRARFPGLVEAGNAALHRCQRIVKGETGASEKPVGCEPEPAAVAIWSLVHGLASLAIDGLIKLPEADSASLKKEVQTVLRAAFAVQKA